MGFQRFSGLIGFGLVVTLSFLWSIGMGSSHIDAKRVDLWKPSAQDPACRFRHCLEPPARVLRLLVGYNTPIPDHSVEHLFFDPEESCDTFLTFIQANIRSSLVPSQSDQYGCWQWCSHHWVFRRYLQHKSLLC
jgi:hypothetical protein